MKVHELFESSVNSAKGSKSTPHVGNLSTQDMGLKTLIGCPKEIIGRFTCAYNFLVNLEGGPEEVSESYACNDNNLTSLDGVASSIGGNFYCSDNNLTSLHNIHKQIKHISGYANFNRNPIKSHVLGLLLIDGLVMVYLGVDGDVTGTAKLGDVEDIINKHLKGDRDVFACQEELIEAGFEHFAQL